MKKILFVLMVIALAVSVAGEYRPLLYGRNCTDMCGDRICQQVVCMGIGCPCAETKESCPEDCENATTAMEQIRERIQQRERQLNQSLTKVAVRLRQIHRNMNRIRLAVHALLEIENRTGSIGRNISAIAREWNNSVKNITQAEEWIQNRTAFARWVVGYHRRAIRILDNAIEQNQRRIDRLEYLESVCNCTSEVREMMQEQIQELQVEQERLQNLSQQQKQKKGVIGWLWK